MKFTKEHKEVKEFSEKLGFGVHKVQIIGFNHGGTEEGEKEYVEIGFVTDDGIEDKARVWLTTDAAINYTFSVLSQVFVHNAPEDKKDAARDLFADVEDPEKMVELLNGKLIGKEMWVTKYLDAKRTYTGSDGRTYQSVNVNIYGYAPKLNESLMPKKGESVAEAAGDVFGTAPAGEDAPPFKGGGTKKEDWV